MTLSSTWLVHITVGQRNHFTIFFRTLRQSHIFFPGIKNDLYHIVIAFNAQYSYNGKLVKYSYASGKVVTLTHCDMMPTNYQVFQVFTKGTSKGPACLTESLEIFYYISVVCWLWSFMLTLGPVVITHRLARTVESDIPSMDLFIQAL